MNNPLYAGWAGVVLAAGHNALHADLAERVSPTLAAELEPRMAQAIQHEAWNVVAAAYGAVQFGDRLTVLAGVVAAHAEQARREADVEDPFAPALAEALPSAWWQPLPRFWAGRKLCRAVELHDRTSAAATVRSPASVNRPASGRGSRTCRPRRGRPAGLPWLGDAARGADRAQ